MPHQGLLRVGMKGFQRLLAQGFQPFLNGVVLLIAQLLQQAQLAAGFHQPFPLGEAHMGVQQLGLPVFDLGVQGFANFEVAIDHDVEHAQRQIGRAGGQAVARHARIGRLLGIFLQAPDDVVGLVAAFGVHADQQLVEHGKPYRERMDAGKRAAAMVLVQLGAAVAVFGAVAVLQALRHFLLGGQAAKNHQFVHRGVVVVRSVAGIGHIAAVQIQQRGAANFVCGLLQQRPGVGQLVAL